MKKNIQKSKKTIISTFVILCLITTSLSSAFGQKKDYQFKQGKIFEAKSFTEDYLGETEDFTFLKCIVWKSLVIEKFDKSLKLVKSAEITLEKGEDELEYVEMIMVGESIYLFGEENNKKLEKKLLYVTTIDKNTLIPSKDWKKVAESKYIDDDYHGLFFIKASENGNFIMIGANHMFKEDVIRHIDISVFNQKMENLFTGLYELPFNFEEIGFKFMWLNKTGLNSDYFKIANDGEVYIMSYLHVEELSKKDIKKGMVQTKLKSSFYLFKFNPEDKTISSTELKLEEYLPINAILEFDTENNPIIAGFYTRGGTYTMNGAYYIKLDNSDLQIMNSEISEFTTEFILNGEKPSKKDQETLKKEGYLTELACQLRNVHITENGKIIVVGEYYTTYTVGSGNYRQTYYVFGDVFIAQFDTKAKSSVTSRIVKRSDTSKFAEFGASSVYVNDNLYVFFNDATKNDNLRNPKDNSVCGLLTKLSSVMVKVDAEGDVNRQKLTDSERNKTLLKPFFAHERNGNVLLYFEDGSDRNLAEVVF